MNPRFELVMDSLPLDALEVELVVAGFFLEDRPLRGGAGRIDWRLCGLISEMLASGQLDARRGTSLLVGAPGAFCAPRILLVGLGSRAEFGVAPAQDSMREAMKRCIALGVHRIGLSPLGIASDDFVRHAVAVAGGVAEAIQGLEVVGGGGDEFEIRLSVPEAGIDAASEALERAVGAFENHEFVARPRARRQHSPSPQGGRRPAELTYSQP